MVKRVSKGNVCLSRYIIPIILKILEAILFMCESHFRCLCIFNPEKTNSSENYILIFSIPILGILIYFWGICNNMNVDFFMLIDNLFNFNQSATFVNSKFKFVEV